MAAVPAVLLLSLRERQGCQLVLFKVEHVVTGRLGKCFDSFSSSRALVPAGSTRMNLNLGLSCVRVVP